MKLVIPKRGVVHLLAGRESQHRLYVRADVNLRLSLRERHDEYDRRDLLQQRPVVRLEKS
jgi:hypothetical protein